ncbi:MAG: type III-B CRISPR module RAMP protein Cmr1 [Planctomycetota bacterium]
MEKIEATYRIVTPMFCGGAEQPAEFRLPSFKGVLRFWWRALEWGRIQDLAKLRKEEAELFGSSDEGQSRFLMRLTQLPSDVKLSEDFSPGLTYLAGMGLCRANGQFHRHPLKPGELVTVEIRVKGGGRSVADLSQLRRVLIAMGIFGGIGARTRRGFGSLTLDAIDGASPAWAQAKSVDALKSQIGELLTVSRDNKSSESPFTAFSHVSHIVLVEGDAGDSAQGLLDKIGRELIRYRSYGASRRDGRRFNVLGEEVTKPNFPDDHDSVHSFLAKGTPVASPPKRAAFGLPHNYFFKSLSSPDVNVKAEVTPEKHDRRASPLFLHIHAPVGAAPIAICTLMPSRFLPEGESLRVSDQSYDKNRKRRRTSPSTSTIPQVDFLKPIHDFLDRLTSRSEIKESFGRIEQLEVPHG